MNRGKKIVTARKVTLSLVFVAVIASLAFDSGIGTPSSFGIGEFFLLCPLGGIEAFLADKAFVPITALSLVVMMILSLVFGRAWCAWGCPAPVIRRFFKREPSIEVASENTLGACGTAAEAATLVDKLRYIGKDGRTWALVVVLAVTFIAGFPLFCLVCPIGLTFGTVGSLWHLIIDKQVTLSVVVFPVALIVELVVYRKWCANLCPIAGLLNIFGQFAVLLRPKVNAQTCLRCDGKTCTSCLAACPEGIDLHAPDTAVQLGECTRCGRCVEQCPTQSVSIR